MLLFMKLFSKALALLLLSALGMSALAQSTAASGPARQNLFALQKIAEKFIQVQTTGLSSTINISIEPVDANLNLPACTEPQAFLPNGGRLMGKTTVGVKCTAPSAWTIYVRATVQVMAEYIAARNPLAQGQTIGPGDIVKMKGDLANLPSGIITEESQAIGRIANMSLTAGAPLRQDALRSNRVVQQGQAVRIVSMGTGFQITTEGRAMTNASEGQMAQAKTASGQVISGTARAGGIIEIHY
jgi:flagella basal body P-ring formation protein FlgA